MGEGGCRGRWALGFSLKVSFLFGSINLTKAIVCLVKFKFPLRIYICVTVYLRLEAWIFNWNSVGKSIVLSFFLSNTMSLCSQFRDCCFVRVVTVAL